MQVVGWQWQMRGVVSFASPPNNFTNEDADQQQRELEAIQVDRFLDPILMLDEVSHAKPSSVNDLKAVATLFQNSR